ncbi:MAG TPA: hypothetical protein GXX38_07590 [Clostridia bacterium]|nr:hypothetical protein [Clostridia bacterium]
MDNVNKMMFQMLLGQFMAALRSSNSPLSQINLTDQEREMLDNLFYKIQSGQNISEQEQEPLLILGAKIARQANLNPASAAQLIGLIENLVGRDKITPEIRQKINDILNS